MLHKETLPNLTNLESPTLALLGAFLSQPFHKRYTCAIFVRMSFWQLSLATCTLKKLPKWRLYRKCAHLTLMKLTQKFLNSKRFDPFILICDPDGTFFKNTQCVTDLDYDVSCLFLSRFWPLLKWALFFEAAGAVLKIV